MFLWHLELYAYSSLTTSESCKGKSDFHFKRYTKHNTANVFLVLCKEAIEQGYLERRLKTEASLSFTRP